MWLKQIGWNRWYDDDPMTFPCNLNIYMEGSENNLSIDLTENKKHASIKSICLTSYLTRLDLKKLIYTVRAFFLFFKKNSIFWRSLWFSMLRIWHCCNCGVGYSCSSDSIHGPGTSISHGIHSKNYIFLWIKLFPHCMVYDAMMLKAVGLRVLTLFSNSNSRNFVLFTHSL